MLALFYVPSPPIPVCISPVLSQPLFIILSLLLLSHPLSEQPLPTACFLNMFLRKHGVLRCSNGCDALHSQKLDHSNNNDWRHSQQPTTPSTSSISSPINLKVKTEHLTHVIRHQTSPTLRPLRPTNATDSRPNLIQTTAATGPSTSPPRSRPFPISSAPALLSSVFWPPSFLASQLFSPPSFPSSYLCVNLNPKQDLMILHHP